MIKIILAIGIVVQVLTVNTFIKIEVDNPDAFCLDGSKPAYYVNQGLKNKFVLSFEGGGWCGSDLGLSETLEDCYQRSKTYLGSSSGYSDTMTVPEGMLSDSLQNPFKDWTMIHMRYCDGTGHQGYKKDPISYKGVKLYFRGHNATVGQLNSVDKNFNIFSAATEIIITGQSAGGLATFLWTNYIAQRAPRAARVWSVPDSGIFLDEMNYNTKTYSYRQLFQNFMSISNEEVDPPNTECVISNREEKWKCMFAQYNFPYVLIPLFPIQSLYDSWSLPNILGIGCENSGSLSACNSSQLYYIDQYRLNMTLVLRQVGWESENNGCWAPACSNHVYTFGTMFYSYNYRVPAYSIYSLAFCLSTWISGKSSNRTAEFQWLDLYPWPGNRPCSGLKQLLSE